MIQAAQREKIAVFGATGHTGRFVVAELLRRGFFAIAIGRSCSRLAGMGFPTDAVEVRTAGIEEPQSLDRALAGVRAVINCAGPFLDTAEAVAAAAMRSRIHYLDVTAEQTSTWATFERFGDQAARAGVVVLPAMGFYGGFADLLATAAMGDWDSADGVFVAVALSSWHPTEGTRQTGKRNTAPRMVIEGGKLVPAIPADSTVWDFSSMFGRQEVVEVPLSEVPLIERHLIVGRLRNYLNAGSLQDLADPSTPPPVAADAIGRSAQTFLVDVVARNGDQTRRIAASGRDIYAFTAPIVVEAVERILDGRVKGSGAMAPGEAFDAADFVRSLPVQDSLYTATCLPGPTIEGPLAGLPSTKIKAP